MPWTMAEKARLVELYHQTGSATEARRRFIREGNLRKGPTTATVLRLVRLFRSTGSVARRARTCKQSAGTQRAVTLIRRAVSRTPTLSVRRLAKRTGISRTRVHETLRKWLGLHPYKLQRVHRLRRGDKAKRMGLCRWLAGKLRSPRWSKFLFMTDEAHFFLDGSVNKANCRVWGAENPRETIPHDHYAPHVTAWCAVSMQGVIGPFFFEERGHTVTVTASRYRNMLSGFFVPELHRRGIPLDKVWIQQDGATAHTTAGVLSFLQQTFGTHVISKNAAVEWPPRSPDLTTPDFFLWGWAKAEVYRTPPTSLPQLKRKLRQVISDAPPAMLSGLREALLARCRQCLRERGGPIEHNLG